MKNDDRITYKLKNKPKKKKENDSNNSRDSLEMEIKSYKANETIKRKKTAAGEEIKFFFNDAITDNKLSKFSISPKPTIKINPRATYNFSKEQSQLNFKDILLNYVKSPKCKNKKKDDTPIERKSTIIYGNPQTVLTLNGDESSEDSQNENDKKSDLKSNSNSESKSGKINLEDIYSNVESSSNNDSIKDKNEQNNNNNKKIDNSKESSYKSNNTSKFDESIKMLPNLNNNLNNNFNHNSNNNSNINSHNNSNINSNINSNNNSKISEKNNEEENENGEYNKNEIKEINEIESEKEVVNNELNQNIPNEIIKVKSSKSNNFKKSNKDSCFNSKHSQNLKSSNGNTFTTTTNTQHTHNTHNTHNTHSSFQSIKINNKKINYNYLCWNNLPLEKKIIIKNRNNSVKRINTNEIIKNKENFIKDEKTSIMLFKLKNLNISLDIEKTYSYYFKYLTKLQNQKNHYKNKSNNSLKNYSNKSIKDYSDNNFYYPDEYYINKNNNLHNKTHVSNLFDKLRKFNNS